MFGGNKKGKNDSSNSMQRFLDIRRDPSSRFKHLRLVMDSIPEGAERKLFIEQHSFEAYHLFHELMWQVESLSSQYPAPRLAVQELECALWLLETIFSNLPELISQRWQYASIALAMKQLLHPQNLLGVRRLAVRLFLQWYQILGVSSFGAQELDAYFASLVPFLPSGNGTTTEQYLTELCETPYLRNSSIRRPTLPDASSVCAVSYLTKKPTPFISPSSVDKNQPNSQNISKSALSQSFMEKILEHISADVTKIQWAGNRTEIQRRCLRFLMEKLRRYYVSICLMDPASLQFDVFRPKLISTNLSTAGATISGNTGWMDDPMIACRHALIRWVAVYSLNQKKPTDTLNNTNQSETSFGAGSKDAALASPRGGGGDSKIPPNFHFIRECLFGSKPMVNLVFAMFRESFLLPLVYASTMGRVFKTLREWLLSDDRPEFFNESQSNISMVDSLAGMQCAYMAIIYVLSSFFNNPYLYKDEERANLIVQISQKILALFKYMACNSCQLAQETWQYLLKWLLNTISKHVPLSPPVGMNVAQPPMVQRLSAPLFQTLLIVWVYAGLYGSVSNEMWDELSDMLNSRTSWPELIGEWGKVVDSVTRALGVAVYGVDILDLPLERLSEQKMIKRQGMSRGMIPEAQDLQKSMGGGTQNQNENSGGGLQAKPMYDFVQGSPVLNGPGQQGQSNSGQSTQRNSDVSVTGIGGTVKSKMSMVSMGGRLQTQMSNVAGSPPQMHLSPEEASLDGSSSWDSSGPTMSSNDGDGRTDGPKESLFGDELMVTTTAPGVDGDDSVSEEFTVADDQHGNVDDCETENVDEESVVAACGPATVYVVWKRILGCLGNVNKVQKPELHLACLQSLEQLCENLFKIKDNQNVDMANQQESIHPPLIVPQQLIISPWLFESLHLSERYHESKVMAMKLLCRIIIHQHRVSPMIDSNILAQFQTILHDSLTSGLDEIISTILIECGTRIFTIPALSNTGTNLLLIDFIRGSASLLNSDTLTKSDRIAVSKFLSSIVCLPNGLLEECPCVGEDWNMKIMKTSIVQKEIAHLLIQLIRSNMEIEIKAECVKGLGLYLAEKFGCIGGCDEEYFTVLLDILPFAGPDLGLLICCTLQPIRELFSFSKPPSHLICRILESFASAFECTLRDLVSNGGQQQTIQRESLAVRLTLDLIDWCVLMPNEHISNTIKKTVQKLVDLCFCIIMSRRDMQTNWGMAQTVSTLLLTFLLSKFNQCGETQSFVREYFTDAQDYGYGKPFLLSSKRKMILSMQEGQSHSRLMFRHGGGRRCWEMMSTRASIDKPSKNTPDSAFDFWLLSIIGDESMENGKKLSKTVTVEMRDGKDSLDRLMRHLNTTSPECFVNPIPSDLSINDYCISTIVNEEAVLNAINQLQLKWKIPNLMHSKITTAAGRHSVFTGGKYLLGSNGQVTWDSHCQMAIAALDNGSERLQRELKYLDGLLMREAHKIAVLYVGDGQEDKQSILANRRGSIAFEDFVAALGWEVDLKTHIGYAGGLSADVHSTVTYFSTVTTETVFHVSTRLPNDDPTKNLRHLGNDEVHIVWSEHWRDYRRSIIATEFCDVLIVIYPLENIPFYRIHIDKRADIADFGPLADGMLVPWPILPTLVRSTAINASRAKRISLANYKNFYEHRLDCLHQAVEKLQAQSSFSNLISSILKSDQTNAAAAGTGGQGQTHKVLIRS